MGFGDLYYVCSSYAYRDKKKEEADTVREDCISEGQVTIMREVVRVCFQEKYYKVCALGLSYLCT